MYPSFPEYQDATDSFADLRRYLDLLAVDLRAGSNAKHNIEELLRITDELNANPSVPPELHFNVANLLGRFYEIDRNFAAANAVFTQLKTPSIAKAAHFSKIGKYDEAGNYYDELLKFKIENNETLHFALKSVERSIFFYKDITLPLDQKFYQTYLRLCTLYQVKNADIKFWESYLCFLISSGQIEFALEVCKAFSSNPKFFTQYIRLLLANGYSDKAQKKADEYLKLLSDDKQLSPELLSIKQNIELAKARDLQENKKYDGEDGALPIYAKYPEHRTFVLGRICCLIREADDLKNAGKLDRLVSICEDAISLIDAFLKNNSATPRPGEFIIAKARALLTLGRIDEAKKVAIDKSNPRYVEFRYTLALCFEAEENYSEAIKLLTNCECINRDEKLLLARCYEKAKMFNDAAKAYIELLNKHPANRAILKTFIIFWLKYIAYKSPIDFTFTWDSKTYSAYDCDSFIAAVAEKFPNVKKFSTESIKATMAKIVIAEGMLIPINQLLKKAKLKIRIKKSLNNASFSDDVKKKLLVAKEILALINIDENGNTLTNPIGYIHGSLITACLHPDAGIEPSDLDIVINCDPEIDPLMYKTIYQNLGLTPANEIAPGTNIYEIYRKYGDTVVKIHITFDRTKFVQKNQKQPIPYLNTESFGYIDGETLFLINNNPEHKPITAQKFPGGAKAWLAQDNSRVFIILLHLMRECLTRKPPLPLPERNAARLVMPDYLCDYTKEAMIDLISSGKFTLPPAVLFAKLKKLFLHDQQKLDISRVYLAFDLLKSFNILRAFNLSDFDLSLLYPIIDKFLKEGSLTSKRFDWFKHIFCLFLLPHAIYKTDFVVGKESTSDEQVIKYITGFLSVEIKRMFSDRLAEYDQCCFDLANKYGLEFRQQKQFQLLKLKSMSDASSSEAHDSTATDTFSDATESSDSETKRSEYLSELVALDSDYIKPKKVAVIKKTDTAAASIVDMLECFSEPEIAGPADPNTDKKMPKKLDRVFVGIEKWCRKLPKRSKQIIAYARSIKEDVDRLNHLGLFASVLHTREKRQFELTRDEGIKNLQKLIKSNFDISKEEILETIRISSFV